MTPFEAKLAQRIDDELTILRGALETRGAVQTIDDFRFITGQIFALKRVTDIYFDDVNSDLNKENNA